MTQAGEVRPVVKNYHVVKRKYTALAQVPKDYAKSDQDTNREE